MTIAALPAKTQHLTRKSAWAAAGLTLLLPVGGYLYTRRFLSAGGAFIFQAACFALLSGAAAPGPALPAATSTAAALNPTTLTGLAFIVGSGLMALENTRAVLHAKAMKAKLDAIRQANQARLQADRDKLRARVLQLTLRGYPMTLDDYLRATQDAVKDIQRVLTELEAENLIRAVAPADDQAGDRAWVYEAVAHTHVTTDHHSVEVHPADIPGSVTPPAHGAAPGHADAPGRGTMPSPAAPPKR